MGKDRDRISCKRCGWDGELRIWGGHYPPYRRQTPANDVTDPMKRPRALPPSWRDGVCAYCRWQGAQRERRAA